MFIWTADNIISQIREFSPSTYEALKDGKIHFSDLEEAIKHIKERLKIEIRNS